MRPKLNFLDAIVHIMFWDQQAMHIPPQFGGGNITAWGCFLSYGIGTLHITEGRMNGSWISQEDNIFFFWNQLSFLDCVFGIKAARMIQSITWPESNWNPMARTKAQSSQKGPAEPSGFEDCLYERNSPEQYMQLFTSCFSIQEAPWSCHHQKRLWYKVLNESH